jgi:hypothetical protein
MGLSRMTMSWYEGPSIALKFRRQLLSLRHHQQRSWCRRSFPVVVGETMTDFYNGVAVEYTRRRFPCTTHKQPMALWNSRGSMAKKTVGGSGKILT